jgi:hypothetical protein
MLGSLISLATPSAQWLGLSTRDLDTLKEDGGVG